MKCSECDYYKSGLNYNACGIVGAEYFRQQNNCDLINNDGTINYNSDYFKNLAEVQDE